MTTKKKCIMGGVLLFGAGATVLLGYYLGASRHLPSQQAAENRAVGFGKTEFDGNMLDLEEQRKTIGDEQFRQRYAQQRELLKYRERIAAHPEQDGCEVYPAGSFDTSHTMVIDIPAGCDKGFKPQVYRDKNEAQVRVEFTTAGGLKLPAFPKFVGDFNESVPCDAATKICRFSRYVYYVHETGGEALRLTLTKVE